MHEDWAAGGEKREWLEIALLETLELVGLETGPGSFKKVKVSWHACVSHVVCVSCLSSLCLWHMLQAAFQKKVVIVKERMESKEREIHGEWMTEEKMVKSGDFSASIS